MLMPRFQRLPRLAIALPSLAIFLVAAQTHSASDKAMPLRERDRIAVQVIFTV